MRPNLAKCGPGISYRHFGRPRALYDMYAEILEVDKIVLGRGPQQHFQKIHGFAPYTKMYVFHFFLFSARNKYIYILKVCILKRQDILRICGSGLCDIAANLSLLYTRLMFFPLGDS